MPTKHSPIIIDHD